jgi:hypothetical protein
LKTTETDAKRRLAILKKKNVRVNATEKKTARVYARVNAKAEKKTHADADADAHRKKKVRVYANVYAKKKKKKHSQNPIQSRPATGPSRSTAAAGRVTPPE